MEPNIEEAIDKQLTEQPTAEPQEQPAEPTVTLPAAHLDLLYRTIGALTFRLTSVPNPGTTRGIALFAEEMRRKVKVDVVTNGTNVAVFAEQQLVPEVPVPSTVPGEEAEGIGDS